VASAARRPAVHLHTDSFYAWIKAGFVLPYLPQARGQNEVFTTAMTAAACAYARGCYDVIAEGILGPWMLPAFQEACGQADVALSYAILRPTLEVTLARAASRAGGQPGRSRSGHRTLRSRQARRHELVLLVVGIVCPQSDQAAEALHDRKDDSIVGERALDVLAGGMTLSFGPGVQLAQLGGQAGLELTPAPDSTRTAGRPGVVVDADQPGNGQQCLTGGPDTKQVRSHRPGVQALPPLPKMLAEVAVEPASSPGVSRECRQPHRGIGAREVDAVMTKEDPVTIGSVAIAGEVCSRGRDDFHAPASIGVPCGQALPNDGRLRQTDRQQIDVR
jgi:hypothetical protein